MHPDLRYYRRRLAEEHAAAEAANSGAVRSCHRTLASMYSKKVAELSAPVLGTFRKAAQSSDRQLVSRAIRRL